VRSTDKTARTAARKIRNATRVKAEDAARSSASEVLAGLIRTFSLVEGM
jgi:hypothetical protein